MTNIKRIIISTLSSLIVMLLMRHTNVSQFMQGFIVAMTFVATMILYVVIVATVKFLEEDDIEEKL